jgi:hypothetical protein
MNVRKKDYRPDYSKKCMNCDGTPVVPSTQLCGPCHFGEADTVAGGWWDDAKDDFAEDSK